MESYLGKRIKLERLEENILGGGSFGVVYKGRLHGKYVAVKVINRHYNQKYWNKLQNETILLKKALTHPNIIEILSYEDKYPEMPEVWIAMELCSDSLYAYLANNSTSMHDVLDIVNQGAEGLLFLHDNNLVHRDIKPDNFLITGPIFALCVKVTDFSLSKDIEGHEESELTSIHGNKHWISPEMFDDCGDKAMKSRFTGQVLKKMDAFSFGLIMLFTCISKEGRKAMCKRYNLGFDVKQGKNVLAYFEHQWEDRTLRQIIEPLLKQMLVLDTASRPSMKDVCEYFTRNVKPVAYYNVQDDQAVGCNNHIILLWGSMSLKLYPAQWPSATHRHSFFSVQDPNIKNSTENNYSWFLETDSNISELVSNIERENIEDLPEPRIAFRKKSGEGRSQLSIYCSNRKPVTICAPKYRDWGDCISVCQNMDYSTAVCDSVNRSLDIYDASGIHQRHVHLRYSPGSKNAIACTNTHLILSEEERDFVFGLHVHSWSGEELHSANTVLYCDELSLDKNYVNGLRISKVHDKFHICGTDTVPNILIEGGRRLIKSSQRELLFYLLLPIMIFCIFVFNNGLINNHFILNKPFSYFILYMYFTCVSIHHTCIQPQRLLELNVMYCLAIIIIVNEAVISNILLSDIWSVPEIISLIACGYLAERYFIYKTIIQKDIIDDLLAARMHEQWHELSRQIKLLDDRTDFIAAMASEMSDHEINQEIPLLIQQLGDLTETMINYKMIVFI